MYPLSAILGMLMSVECKWGMVFMLAPLHRFNLRSILFVAFIFVLSSSMKTLCKGCPVSWNRSTSFSALALEVHPMSRMRSNLPLCAPILLLLYFVVEMYWWYLWLRVYGSPRGPTLLPPALWLGRIAGANNRCNCLQGFLLIYYTANNFLLLCNVPSPCHDIVSTLLDFQPTHRLLELASSS